MGNEVLTDERLRALYQRALEARGMSGRERCAAPEAMLAVLRREGPEEQRLEVLDHVMGCRACRSEFDLLRSIEQAGAGTEETRPATLRILRRPAWRAVAPFALAASILLVVAVGPRFTIQRDPDVERGASGGVTLLGPAPGSAAELPLTFAWTAVKGARGYELEVLDEKGAVVFAEKTAETSVTLPDARHLTPGASYRWWVRATTASGDQLSSEVRSVRLRMK
jgi:hypothetical protein